MAFDGFRFKKWFHNDIKIWENLEMIVRKVTSSNMGILLGMPANHGEKIWDSYWIQSKLGQFILGWSPIRVAVGTEPGDIYIYNYNYNYVCVCILLYIYIYLLLLLFCYYYYI